jgi:hypothetical protein
MSAAAAPASASHAADHECAAGGTTGSLKQGGNVRPFGIPANQHLSQGTEPNPDQ